MSRSTDRARPAAGWALASTFALGACATLDMPTPIEHIQTHNQMAPSYEYRPPPPVDAGIADAGPVDAASSDARLPDAVVPEAVVPDAMAGARADP